MDNTTIETVVETTDVEQPKKPKREKPVPGRNRGAVKKSCVWVVTHRINVPKELRPLLCQGFFWGG